MSVSIGKFGGLACAISLSACATIDTGAIDYRRAEDIKDVPSRITDYVTTRCKTQAKQDETGKQVKTEVCPPLLGARLFRQNVSSKPSISKGEVYSIRLDHAYMKYVAEIGLRGSRILEGRNPFRAQAEIVVLARAFEFAAKNKENLEISSTGSVPSVGQEGAFVNLDLESLNEARVIYYSPDVENGQSLNLSNVPILGPIKYEGRPVGIQVIVLELDRVSDEMKGLLSNLASLGQTAGALPSSGVGSVLTGLGKSLLENNQDDVIFEYRFVLDSINKANSYESSPFEAGRYVLRRLHNREWQQVWRNLELDHNSGRLFEIRRKSDGEYEDGYPFPFTDETYFTLNIVNHGANAEEASYYFEDLNALRARIETAASTREDVILGDISAEIEAATQSLRAQKALADLTDGWSRVQNNIFQLAYNTLPSPGPAGCTVISQTAEAKGRARFGIIQDVADLRIVTNEAELMQDAGGNTIFADKQKQRLARHIGEFFASYGHLEGAVQPAHDTFTDMTKFSAFLDDSTVSGLLGVSLAYAEALAPKTCDELVALGIATKP